MTINELENIDKSFVKSEFLAKVDNTYIMLLSSIMFDEMPKVEHKLSRELYDNFVNYVNELKNKNLIQMYDEMNVASTSIVDIYDDPEAYYIKVLLVSRYIDYRISKTNGNFINGINDHRIEKNNYLIFRKYKSAFDNNIIKKCPTCGASINPNETGICSFCRCTYDLAKHDWILMELTNE